MEAATKRSAWLGFFVLILVVLSLDLFHRNLGAEETKDETKNAPRVSEECLICHDGYDKTLADNPHRLDPEALNGPDARIACTDCHAGGDPRHYEEDPEAYPMTNPAELDVAETAHICSTCHMNSHQQNMMEDNVHARNDVNCLGCHRIHGSKEAGLLKTSQFELCTGCHTDVEGQFARPFRHPVNDGIVKCSECHMTLDRTRTELSLNGSNACFDCHPEFEGPFPYEHQATLDFSTEEGGCLNCHDPHGSDHPRMLKQPYEPPHFQLCTQCHSVPPLHNQNFKHGDRWAGVACNECHTDIHGSYTSRALLSESLESQGCFSAGCHPPGR